MEPKDFKEIKTIIDLMKKNGLSVFEIEKEGFRLKMERGPSGQAAAVAALPMAVPPKAATAPTFFFISQDDVALSTMSAAPCPSRQRAIPARSNHTAHV